MDSECVDRIVAHVAKQPDVVVKSQQRGEPDLNLEGRTAVLKDALANSPLTFLERWGKTLLSDDLDVFENLKDTELDTIIYQLHARLDPERKKHQVRNRRYQHMQKLDAQGDYFSDSAMKQRAPELFQEYIGQYQSMAEKQEQTRIDSDQAHYVGGGKPLTAFFMRAMDATANVDEDMYDREEEEEEENIEEFDTESEDEEDMSSDEKGRKGKESTNQNMDENDTDQVADFAIPRPLPTPIKPDDEESIQPNQSQKELLREEFLRIMHERFIDGKDMEYDYGAVDSDEELDEHVEHMRDLEDKYFDED